MAVLAASTCWACRPSLARRPSPARASAPVPSPALREPRGYGASLLHRERNRSLKFRAGSWAAPFRDWPDHRRFAAANLFHVRQPTLDGADDFKKPPLVGRAHWPSVARAQIGSERQHPPRFRSRFRLQAQLRADFSQDVSRAVNAEPALLDGKAHSVGYRGAPGSQLEIRNHRGSIGQA